MKKFICCQCFSKAETPIIAQGSWFCSKECLFIFNQLMMKQALNLGNSLASNTIQIMKAD